MGEKKQKEFIKILQKKISKMDSNKEKSTIGITKVGAKIMKCSKCGTEMKGADNKKARDFFNKEWYKCPSCGHVVFLDYEEMR